MKKSPLRWDSIRYDHALRSPNPDHHSPEPRGESLITDINESYEETSYYMD